MGDVSSKATPKYGNLSEEEVDKIKNKLHLINKEINDKINIADFIFVFPNILRPYIYLVLTSFHELHKQTDGKKGSQSNNYEFNYALNILFNKNFKKNNNETCLQNIINILSYIRNSNSHDIIKTLFTSFLKTDNQKNILIFANSDISNDKNNSELDKEKGNTNISIKDVRTCSGINDKVDDELEKKIDLIENNLSESNGNIIDITEKNALKNQYPEKYTLQDLISVEEAFHHLFAYMYIEQLYLLSSNNILLNLNNCNKNINNLENKDSINDLKQNESDIYSLPYNNNKDENLYFINDPLKASHIKLNFKNIIMGFRLYVNGVCNNNNNSIFSLAVKYINSTFVYMSNNYSMATFKHFMDSNDISSSESWKKNETNSNNLIDLDSSIKLEGDLKNFDEACIKSLELIHYLYKNKGKNGSTKHGQNDENEINKSNKYEKSSSVLQTQNLTKGLKGVFLNSSSRILTDEIVFALRQCSSCFINNEWYKLYASWKEGTSFNRFINSFFYYPSPIIIVLKTKDNQILGGVCTTPLKDSHIFYGSSNDFLFSASPVFRVIRSSNLGSNYIYLNSKNSFYPKGLGFGGRTECFRLFLSDEFKNSYCTESDYTYERGHLYFPDYQKKNEKEDNVNNKENDGNDPPKNTNKNTDNYYNDDLIDEEYNGSSFLYKLSISEVEVWGCGDKNSLEEQLLMQRTEEASKQERRMVDKTKIVQNSFDKEFLFPKVFTGGKYEKLSNDT
ncbi:uncharacterized protein PY17X_1362800 [Plasmodium yoelii]|uniref:Oxidation resistance protein 1 n=3 Tax=Plasmodium yoelii TaxID=5861 RepID=A0AAE9X210_PLAYO|nr:uncharacterized protein PY17X_1362800 [Plasmodium yoelii]WBY60362.1 TLD domain-containing protein [Plasmodium yoelii yoelii]CDU20238.1 conserved Plasmodium protein, unknown function [Plasmodium yoelii]VTZ80996.1 TLD domain-containing protein, putative [Plasmodium yoelii]|eukprot:XP_726097.2 uncharacterized protein PY17X_1362800 [Plasmodium yoelii]